MSESASVPPSGTTSELAERPVESSLLTRRKPATELWLLTGLCLAIAIGLGGWSWYTRGIEITVQFLDGHGLKAENRLMHRGIEVGAIERVRLDKTLGNVEVLIRLNDSASALACEGSRFWIERPIASVQGVRSLETILSGRYIAVEPGPDSSKREFSFQGLNQTPQPSIAPGALEIVLEASERHGLQVNAPVIYRGLEVGFIQSIGLSADSRWVQIRAVIDADYRSLVREDSRFWNRSGFRIDVGLSGVEVDAESLSTVAIGGIEFATPESTAKPAKTGRRFELASRVEKSWLEWRPRILYGAILPKGMDESLSPMRFSKQWQSRTFGFRQNQSQGGWILLLSDDSVLGPSDLFDWPANAIEGSVRWEAAGLELKPEQITAFEASPTLDKAGEAIPVRISRYRLRDFVTDGPRWPLERLEAKIDNTVEPTRLWIAGDVPSRWIPVEPHQIVPAKGDGWVVDSGLGISSEHHGAPVIDGEKGYIVGEIVVDKRSVRILSVR